MNLYYLSETQMLAFALVLLRVSAFFVVFPLVENGSIPNSIKILLSFIVTIVMYPVVDARGIPSDILAGSLFILSIKEVFMGIFLGFISKFFFQALAVCGDIITMALGLSADQMYNPHLERRVTVVEQFEVLIGGLFFLGMNGHHIFIQGLAQSFDFMPLAKTTINFVTLRDISMIVQDIIVFGIKLSAPVMGAIFVTNIGMGIVGRAVPQINVLVMSWPVNIILGFLILFISLPLFMISLKENLNWGATTLFEILKHI